MRESTTYALQYLAGGLTEPRKTKFRFVATSDDNEDIAAWLNTGMQDNWRVIDENVSNNLETQAMVMELFRDKVLTEYQMNKIMAELTR